MDEKQKAYKLINLRIMFLIQRSHDNVSSHDIRGLNQSGKDKMKKMFYHADKLIGPNLRKNVFDKLKLISFAMTRS